MSKIGVHVAKISKVLKGRRRKTYIDAIKNDVDKLNLGCVQIFTAGPSNSRMNDMDYISIREFCDDSNINLYVHSSYLTIGIFGITPENKDTPKSKAAIKHLTNQMDACDSLGSKGFVVHLPRKDSQYITNSLKVVIPILKKYNTPFMLEMPASRSDPDKTYETPQKMDRLNELIFETYPNFTNWSWVIDTAHLWSCGVEVDEYNVMKKWFKDLKYPEKIGLFHLNGSSLEHFKSGKDKHRVVCGTEDDIWYQDANMEDGLDMKKIKKSTINLIAKFTKKYSLDLVCEINRGDFDEIKFSIKILNHIFK
jgi:endonuclease IV